MEWPQYTLLIIQLFSLTLVIASAIAYNDSKTWTSALISVSGIVLLQLILIAGGWYN